LAATLPPRLGPAVTLAVLAGVLVVYVAVTTPWHPAPAPPPPDHRAAPRWQTDFTEAERAHEQSYHRAVRPPAYLGLAVGLVAIAVLGLTSLGARLVHRAGAILGGGWVAQAILGALAIGLVLRAVTLPFDVLAERAQRRFSLSTQTWASWTLDQIRGVVVATAILVPVVVIGYALVRRLPTTWWAWLALITAAGTVTLSYLYPVLIEPIFNRFTPMSSSPLRTELLELAQRDGVGVSDVLVADASRRTTAENAYVSGFGRTRRIVVYDTLLKASPEEVQLVVAHELEHAKQHDVARATAEAAVAGGAAVCVLALVATSATLLRRAGINSIGDPRSLALVLFVVAILSQLAQPAFNVVSRRVEARADVHSLDITGDPATFVRVERRLALSNLSDLDPSPVVYALFATHPSTTERIALARDWAKARGLALSLGEKRDPVADGDAATHHDVGA
jgi:STE24 endopeptidase